MVKPSELPQRAMRSIRARIASGAGLEPPEWVLEARVLERMKSLGLSEAEAYSDVLASSAELGRLVELLRVGETSFFRHKSQLRALEELVVPTMQVGAGEARVWSAGCATGEEPYTLAMILAKAMAGRRPLKILASDISDSGVQLAREGIYSANACASVPPLFRAGLDRVDDKRMRISQRLRDLVSFEVRNLSVGPYPSGFDLVFCRNVLIYFGPEAKAAALKRLVASLKPGAFLFLGYSESLREVEGLEAVSGQDATLYRKLGGPERRKRRTSMQPAAPRSHSPASLKIPLARPTAQSTEQAEARHVRPAAATTPVPMPTPIPMPSSVALPTPLQLPTPVALPSAAQGQAALAPSATTRIALSGEYADASRLAQELRPALRSPGSTVIVDLDGADFLGDEAANVLKRMRATARSMNIELRWSSKRSGHLRFIRRHELDEVDS